MHWLRGILLLYVFSDTYGQNYTPIHDTILPITFTCGDDSQWAFLIDQKVGSGFRLSVLGLNFDYTNESWLQISSDENFDSTRASVAYLTGKLEPVNFTIAPSDTLFLKAFCNPEGKDTFELLLMATGDPAVTEPPITQAPTPPPNVAATKTVNFQNITSDEFQSPDQIAAIQGLLAEFAKEFSNNTNIDFQNKSDDEMIFLKQPRLCPITWHMTLCVTVDLQIFVRDQPDYQLDKQNLDLFWKMYRDNERWKNLGFLPYDFPDQKTPLLWMLLWLLIATIIIIIGFVVFCQCQQLRDKVFELTRLNSQKEKEEELVKRRKEEDSRKKRSIEDQEIPSFMTTETSFPSSPQASKKIVKPILKTSLNPPVPETPATTTRFEGVIFTRQNWNEDGDDDNEEEINFQL